VQSFIQSIAFNDAKRKITKDLLMRIDLIKIVEGADFLELQSLVGQLDIEDWESYKEKLTKSESLKNRQLDIFSSEIQAPSPPKA
jgi:hypothetical protein